MAARGRRLTVRFSADLAGDAPDGKSGKFQDGAGADVGDSGGLITASSGSSTTAIRLPVLRSLFTRIDPLGVYLNRVIKKHNIELREPFEQDTDHVEYHSMLQHVIVCTPRRVVPPTLSCGPQEYNLTQKEIVLQCIQATLATDQQPNVIRLGFTERGDGRNHGVMGAAHIQNIHANDEVSRLQSRHWRTLSERIGVGLMKHLLLERDLFELLPNDCAFQLCGLPVPQRVRQVFKPAAPGHCVFIRHTFYSDSFGHHAGFPAGNYLRRLAALKHGPALLLRKVFVEGYTIEGLASTNSKPGNKTKSAPIKRGRSPRISPRLARLVPEFARMLDSIAHTDFGHLLRTRAPLPQAFLKVKQAHKPLPAAALPRVLTWRTLTANVSSFVKACLNTVIPKPLWGSAHMRRHVFQLVDRFLRLNRNESLSTEAMLYGLELNQISWLRVQSANDGQPAAQKRRGATGAVHLSPTDHTFRRQCAGRWLHWMFTALVVPLVRNHFFVTETEPWRQRVVYYRKPVWAAVRNAAFTNVQAGLHLEPLTPAAVVATMESQSRQFGAAPTRLLPKSTGVRPIMQLASWRASLPAWCRQVLSAPALQRIKLSVNRVMSPVHQVLKFEKLQSPHLLGASVFGFDGIYEKFRPFSLAWHAAGRPKLYCVCTDVVKCYDTMHQDKLLQIMASVTRHPEYAVRSFQAASMLGGSVVRPRSCSAAVPAEDLMPFQQFAHEQCCSAHSKVLQDSVYVQYVSDTHVQELLLQHVQNNVVNVNGQLFVQRQGIAQGSVVSCLLCSFYYGHMEAECIPLHLRRFRPGHGALLRMVDDYLFFSTKQEDAEEFLQLLVRGFPQYGCKVNAAKTRVNFDVTVMDPTTHTLVQVPRGDTPASDGCMRWCGFQIDTTTLSVYNDMSRYTQLPHLQDSITISPALQWTAQLSACLHNGLRPKCHPMLIDSTIQSLPVVATNVYHIALLGAVKLHAGMKRVRLSLNALPGPGLHKIIVEGIDYLLALIRTRTTGLRRNRTRPAGNRAPYCALTASQVRWLMLHAFRRVFRTRPAMYRREIHLLQCDLSRPVVAAHTKSLARIAFRAGQVLRHMKY